MRSTFEPLLTTDSILSRLDPRWKLAALMPAAGAAAVLQTLPAATVAFLGSLLLALLGRLPLRWYLARLGTVCLLVAPFAIFLPFLHGDGGPGWNVGPVRLSLHGSIAALVLMLKAWTIVTVVLVLLATAPLHATLKAAQLLHIPGLVVHLVVLAYRYIFVLAGELSRLRVALRVRGYRNRMSVHCYRTIGHVAGTLLVRGHEQAERVAQAMRCRGFDGRFRSLAEFRTTLAEVVAFLLIAGGAAELVVWDVVGVK